MSTQFLAKLTPETAEPGTLEVPITMPKILWLALAQVAEVQGKTLESVCQEVFEAGINAKLHIKGVGITPEDAILSADAPGGRA
jgi:hypothetical protein